MGIERGGGGGEREYWRPPVERFRSREARFEVEPALHRGFWSKNKLVSQLYSYASGQSHTSPTPQVTTPQDAMTAYLNITAAVEPTTVQPPPIVTPPRAPTEILFYDPFSDHQFRLNSDARANASDYLNSMLSDGKKTRQAVTTVDEALTKFVEDFTVLPDVPRVDKLDVAGKLDEDAGLASFGEGLLVLVSKYLAVKQRRGKYATQEELEKVLKNGFYAYVKTFSADIPYYDRVYEDLDSQRVNGRTPQEIYLGRDGMYAHLGRRAKDLSTRRAMGLKKRLSAKKKGKKIAIKPKYLVYPRFYRDQLSEGTKAMYLESQGINAQSDPIFFDTGYTGTVPEQILNILGIGSEADERIKMLSARSPKRRVKGISPDERDSIVEKIEYNIKPEEPSSAIMKTPGGRLKAVAKPTTPEEQFVFGMIRMALVRHYWLDARSLNP